MKKHTAILTAAAFAIFSHPLRAMAQNVLNGSFEAPFTVPPYYRYVPADASIPFWALIGTGLGEQSYLFDFGSPGSPYSGGTLHLDGIHALRLSWGDTVSQTVSNFVVGRAYRSSFIIEDDGSLGTTIVSFGSVTQAFTGIATQSLVLVANASTQTLSFTAFSPANDATPSGVVLDDVHVVPFAEPAILSITGYPGIDITGTVGGQYQLQCTPSVLTANWTPLTNFVLQSSPFRCYEIATNANQSNKFFRAVTLP